MEPGLSGSFSGSFQGDGSALTGVSAFPFTGDAEITGSLLISGSNTSGLEIRGPIQVHHSGSPAARFSANSDTAEEVLIYDSKIIIEDSGYEMVKLSGNLYGSRAGVLDLRRWSTNSGAVITSQPTHTSYIQSSLLIGKDGTVNSTHPYKLDVDGDIKLGNGTDDSIEILGPVTASTDISSSATSTASFGHYLGDGSQLTNLPAGSTPTLQQVTTAGNITDQGLIVSGSTIFKPNTSVAASIEFSAQAYSGFYNPTITLKNSSDQKTVHIGHSANDGLFELYNSTEKRVVSIQENFQAFSPPSGLNSGYGTYFGVTSSISPSIASPDSYVKIAHDGYSGVPYSILQLNKKGNIAGYGSVSLYGIMSATSTSAPSLNITSNNGTYVANFGGPGFTNASSKQNNYLKYGLQIGGDFTGTNASMPLTDGSLIMSGSTGAFSLKSVSSEAEIKTNGGDTTLTLGTTSSFDHIEATSFKGDGSQLTNLPASSTFPFTGDAEITGSLNITGSFTAFGAVLLGGHNSVAAPTTSSLKIDKNGSFYHLGRYVGNQSNFANNSSNTVIGNNITSDGDYYNTIIGESAGVGTTTNQTAIGRGAIANVASSTAIGSTSKAYGVKSTSIGQGAGSTTSKGLNIGYNARGTGAKNIVLNASEGTVGPTKASTFGVYLTNSSPVLEIQATGSSTLSGSSFTIEKSGSTVFEVIGSAGTLFAVDDDLTGTLFTANDASGIPVLQADATGEVYIGKSPQSLYTTAVISSTTAATTQSIYGLSLSSYDGAFFDYTVQSGSDARAGSIMSVWNGSNISFTETTTLDIGDTTDFNLIVHISESQAQIASHASRAGYNIKTIIRSI